MTQFRAGEVWSERETGDWEACVATSYAMGLLYAGVTMPAPYTQGERERLEVRADEPQDLAATDAQALAVYGTKLRQPTVQSSKEAFLARPGLGFCLTGTGSPLGYQAGTFTHEIFAVAKSATVVTVYDPLAPAGYAPTDMALSAVAAWMKGVGSNQVREIEKEGLGMTTIVDATLFLGPDGEPAQGTLYFAQRARPYTSYALDGTTEELAVGPAGTNVPVDARVVITQDPDRSPHGNCLRITAGVLLDHPYIGYPDEGLTLEEPPKPAPEPEPGADYDKGVADEHARWAAWLSERPQSEQEVWLYDAPTMPGLEP